MKKILLALLLILAAGLGAAKAWIDHRLRGELNRALAVALPGIGVSYEQAQVSLPGAVVIENFALHLPGQADLHIARLEVPRAYRYLRQLPAQGQVRLDGVRVDLAETTASLAVLFKAVGYGDYYLSRGEQRQLLVLRADLLARFAYDGAARELNVSAELHSADLGDWRAEAQFEDVADLRRAWPQWPLRGARLSYRDNGLLPRLSTYLAGRGGREAVDLRADLALRLAGDLEKMRLPFTADSVSALQNFVRQPTRLELRATPPKAVPLQILGRYLPAHWPAVLGLQLTQAGDD